MKKGDSNYSIMYLKQKFDEIRRNISNIEQRQKEFFTGSSRNPSENSETYKAGSLREYSFEGYPNSQEAPVEEPPASISHKRPASVGRFSSARANSNREGTYHNLYYTEIIRKLEQEKTDLLHKISQINAEKEELIRENNLIKAQKNSQAVELEQYRSENERLKRELELSKYNRRFSSRDSLHDYNGYHRLSSSQKLELSRKENRPSSCLRSEANSPKKNRVVFSKDLVKVVHISDDDYKRHSGKMRSPSPVRTASRDISPNRTVQDSAISENAQRYTRSLRTHSIGDYSGNGYKDETPSRSEWRVTRPNQNAFHEKKNLLTRFLTNGHYREE